jgi:HD-GYP domain-containing protein (c-di-GMP phosphodiesterase class II)
MEKGSIIVLNGVHRDRDFEIDRVLTIGRHPDNHIQLLNQGTSRFHAELIQRDDGHWVKDLNSKGGTYVQGTLTTERRLEPGDELVVGDVRMRFSTASDPARKPPKRTTVSFDLPGEEDLQSISEVSMNQPSALNTTNPHAESSDELNKLYNMLYQANLLISSAAPAADVYDEILKNLFTMVSADRGIILVVDPQSDDLVTLSAQSRDKSVEDSHVRVSRTIVNRAMEKQIALLTSDAMSDAQFASGASIFAQQIRSVICAPLIYKDEVLGVIYLDTQRAAAAFDQEVLRLVTAIASSAAIAIKNATYVDQLKTKTEALQQSYLNTINVIANAIEARDKYTLGHAWRVTRFALALAEQLGWDDRRKEILEMGGLIHDVGKVGVRDAILCKNARLTDDEFELMKLHPEIGARILKDVPFLVPAAPYTRFHHERWDGSGYPQGLAGEEIPIEGRLLAIADAFDAMTSNRVYRRGRSPEAAIEEIERCAGNHFDPALAALFIEVYEAGKVNYILQNKAIEEAELVLCPVCSTQLTLDENAKPGDEMDCPICRKQIRLVMREEGLFAEPCGLTMPPENV